MVNFYSFCAGFDNGSKYKYYFHYIIPHKRLYGIQAFFGQAKKKAACRQPIKTKKSDSGKSLLQRMVFIPLV